MKVCYVTHASNLTGASQSLLDMLSGWKEYDIEPVVLLHSHGPLEKALKGIGVRTKVIKYTTSVKSKKKFGKEVDFVKLAINHHYSIDRIKKFFLDEQFDLIHNNSLLVGIGMQAAQESQIPYICHLREFVEEDHKLDYLDKRKQYDLIKRSTVAIAISNIICSKYKNTIPKADIITIYDGINTKKYYSKHSKIMGMKEINVLLPGRLSENKRQIDAIKAMEILYGKGMDNIKLIIIGGSDSSDYMQRIYQYVKSNKVPNVTFLPFGDLKRLREEADIGLMCSSNEGMGRVTIESMLAGCLTIGANAGATPELIEDGVNGYLYEVGNPESLAEMIIRAIENKDEARRVAKIGQRYAIENYGVQAYCSKIYEIYRKVLQ